MQTISNTSLILKRKLLIMDINLLMQAASISSQSVFIQKNMSHLKNLPEGATILISNSVADHGRVLALLESKGLIKLAEGVDKTTAEIKDIVENPKNLQFDANYDPAIIATALQ